MNRIIFCIVCFALSCGNLFGRPDNPVKGDTAGILENEVETLLRSEVLSNTSGSSKGGIYFKLGEILSSNYCHTKALEYYQRAFSVYREDEDLKNACIALAAKAKCEFMLARYDSSIANYREALVMAGRIKDTSSTIRILNGLSAVMLCSTSDAGSDKSVIEQGTETIGIPPEQLAALCANAAALERNLGEDAGELQYRNGDERIKDSLNQAGEEFLAGFNALKASLEKTAAENKRMAAREKYIFLFFTGWIFLMGAAGIYLYRRLIFRQRELAGREALATEKANRMAVMLNGKMANFKRFLDLSSGKRERPGEFLSAFKKYINIENGRLPDAFGDLLEIANLYHNGLIVRLQLAYPALNDEELHMCALMALDFPISSIKFIYNHASDDSMYNKRARLKKKLGLGPDERLEKFIRELTLEPLASC